MEVNVQYMANVSFVETRKAMYIWLKKCVYDILRPGSQGRLKRFSAH